MKNENAAGQDVPSIELLSAAISWRKLERLKAGIFLGLITGDAKKVESDLDDALTTLRIAVDDEIKKADNR